MSIKGKKWYWALLVRQLDMAVVHTYTLFNMGVDKEKEMTIVDFRREVTQFLLKTNYRRGEPRPIVLEGRLVSAPPS